MKKKAKPKKAWAIKNAKGALAPDGSTFPTKKDAELWTWEDEKVVRVLITEI